MGTQGLSALVRFDVRICKLEAYLYDKTESESSETKEKFVLLKFDGNHQKCERKKLFRQQKCERKKLYRQQQMSARSKSVPLIEIILFAKKENKGLTMKINAIYHIWKNLVTF